MLLALTVTIAPNGLIAEAASATEDSGDMSTHALMDRALVVVGQGDRTDLDWTAPVVAPLLPGSPRRRAR